MLPRQTLLAGDAHRTCRRAESVVVWSRVVGSSSRPFCDWSQLNASSQSSPASVSTSPQNWTDGYLHVMIARRRPANIYGLSFAAKRLMGNAANRKNRVARVSISRCQSRMITSDAVWQSRGF